MKKIEIYTDGACSGNPGVGGYGAVLIYKGKQKQISGVEAQTTNNQMEIFAVISALKQVKEPCDIKLYSDSAYVVNAFANGWIWGWIANGWRTSGKDEVKNKEMWQTLLELLKPHKVEWIKVKGHADNEFNNLCDKLATDEIKKYKKVQNGNEE